MRETFSLIFYTLLVSHLPTCSRGTRPSEGISFPYKLTAFIAGALLPDNGGNPSSCLSQTPSPCTSCQLDCGLLPSLEPDVTAHGIPLIHAPTPTLHRNMPASSLPLVLIIMVETVTWLMSSPVVGLPPRLMLYQALPCCLGCS